jgi:hypothetical protein
MEYFTQYGGEYIRLVIEHLMALLDEYPELIATLLSLMNQGDSQE